MAAVSNPSTQETETGDPRTNWLPRGATIGKFRVLWKTLPQKWKVIEEDTYHQLWVSICTRVHPHTCKHTKVIFKKGGYMTKYFKVGIIKLVFIEGFIYPLQSFKLNHITTRFKYYHSFYFKLGTYFYPGIRRLRQGSSEFKASLGNVTISEIQNHKSPNLDSYLC